MEINEAIKKYEELKNNKEIIANIDKDFFFEFADIIIEEHEKLMKLKEHRDVTFLLGQAVERDKWKDRIIKKIQELDIDMEKLDKEYENNQCPLKRQSILEEKKTRGNEKGILKYILFISNIIL